MLGAADRGVEVAAGEGDGDAVAAEPAEVVALADRRRPRRRDLAEEEVAALVALDLVDRVEVVEVEDGDAERRPVPPGVGEEPGEGVAPGGAARQPGHRVAEERLLGLGEAADRDRVEAERLDGAERRRPEPVGPLRGEVHERDDGPAVDDRDHRLGGHPRPPGSGHRPRPAEREGGEAVGLGERRARRVDETEVAPAGRRRLQRRDRVDPGNRRERLRKGEERTLEGRRRRDPRSQDGEGVEPHHRAEGLVGARPGPGAAAGAAPCLVGVA